MVLTAKSVLRYGTIALVGILLVFYIYTQSITYLRGPQLIIHGPINGISTSDIQTTVSGNARNVSFITINGRQIYANESGDFTEKLLLNSGYNIITINVTDRFNRSVTKNIHLTYTGEARANINSLSLVSTSTPAIDTGTTTDIEITDSDTEHTEQ